MTALLIVVGLVGLFLGGEILVRGAVGLATRLRIAPFVIGSTVVGFGTSSPELVTSIDAALIDAPGIAVGNVIGSNVANILLILGVAALIQPVRATPAAFRRDGAVLVIASLACLAVVLSGTVTRFAGAAFVIMLAAYLAGTFFIERNGRVRSPALAADDVGSSGQDSLPFSVAALAGGIALVILGARFLVDGAVTLARDSGLSEAAIGLTVVAIGTSLPELATSAVAARRGSSDIAIGNVVGSSIFNILAILGVTALVTPVAVPVEIARFDIWVMLAATVALVVVTVTGWRVSRREGAALLAGYAVFLIVVLMGVTR